MKTLIDIVNFILLIWFAGVTFYMLFYAVSSLFFRVKKQVKTNVSKPSFLVLIPAYKEDDVILKTAEHALNQAYDKDLFQVKVIADQFSAETLAQLEKLPLEVIEVKFEQSTKAKAINFALAQVKEEFDFCVILDADNVITPNFLSEIAPFVQAGHKAIQGHRTAKNSNTAHAVLDAISEEINNNIFCKGPQTVGFSSRLTGSGMAFEFNLFKRLMANIHAVGGFDKHLELALIQEKVEIVYAAKAVVFDEKVSKSEVLTKQRSRWISSQFHYLKRYGFVGVQGLFANGNLDLFNKSLQLYILPRVFMLLSFIIGFSSSFITGNLTTLWVTLGLLYVSVFIIAFPKKHFNKELLAVGLILPKTIFNLFLNLPQLVHANKQFIHTPHES